jgi:hypothetical protein
MLYGFFWQEVFPWPTPEDETPGCTSSVSGDYIAEVLDLEPGLPLPYCFECNSGGELDFSVSSTLPIDLILCTGDQFECWADEDFHETARAGLDFRQGFRSISVLIPIQANGEYFVILVNPHSRRIPVMVSANLKDPPQIKCRKTAIRGFH